MSRKFQPEPARTAATPPRETDRLRPLTPEPLSPDAFRPFGQVVRKPAHAPQLAVGCVQSWTVPFEGESPAQIMLNRFHRGSGRFSVLERHTRVTQCFFPLGGVGFIMVVAEATPDRAAPEPESVRAFVVEGAQGILLWTGTWHSIARFPIDAPHVDMCFVTDVETQAELEACKADGSRPRLTHYVDFERTLGIGFEIVGYTDEADMPEYG